MVRDDDYDDVRMPLGEHLEELRIRSLRIAAALVVFCIVGFFFENDLKYMLALPFQWAKEIVGPEALTELGLRPLAAGVRDFRTLSLQESPLNSMRVTFYCSFALLVPYILVELWGFVAPALRPPERRLAFLFLPVAVIFFYAGVVFGYFFGVKHFFALLMKWNLRDPTAVLAVRQQEYLGFFVMLTLSFGLIMDIPWLVMVLVRLRLVTTRWLARQRKYVLLIAIVASAMLTPPDPFSQLAFFLPILLLFESGLLMSRIFFRRQAAHDPEDA